MNEGPRYVSFRDYLRVARERRLLVILITLLFAGSAYLYTVRATPTYRAEAAIQFDSPNQQASLVGVNQDVGGQTPEQRAAANASMVTRGAVLRRAKEILKTSLTTKDIRALVAANPEARTQLVIVQSSDTSGEGAAALANAVADAAVLVTRDETRKKFARAATSWRRVVTQLSKSKTTLYQRNALQPRITLLDQLAKDADPASVRRRATVPDTPESPRKVVTTLLGLLIGLTLGLVAAFTRDSLDRRFKSLREISEELHFPMLGYVQEHILGRTPVNGKSRKSLSNDDLEGFRILKTNIEFLDVDDPPKLVVVTSALPEEGKSTVSAALAAAYVQAGKRTLIVEGDLRRPTLAGRLGIATQPGLTDYLVGNATPAEVLQTIPLGIQSSEENGAGPEDGREPTMLVAIVAGSPAPQPAELLGSNRCRAFFEQVKEVYDVIVVDSCPLLSVVDTLELLPASDAIVICMRASKTTRDQARAAKAAISHLPERPTGVVITGVRAREEGAYYGYYSYGTVYGSTGR